jgi:hypothetical protein
MATSALLRAVSSFVATVGKQEHFVRQGEVLPANHPAVKGREPLFEPAQPVAPAVKSK